MRNRALKDYAGVRFGQLVAVRMLERGDRPENNHLWLFRCDCGRDASVRIKSARSGHTVSCGCAQRKAVVERNTVHGLMNANRGEYRSWKDMRARCRNPNNSDYANYGGRGVQVCERWNSFEAFLADMGPRPAGQTIDRVDVNGNYEPTNCRWADARTQANNKRSNSVIEYQGRKQTLQQWSDEFGLESSKIRWRMAQGWPLEKVFGLGDFRIDGAVD